MRENGGRYEGFAAGYICNQIDGSDLVHGSIIVVGDSIRHRKFGNDESEKYIIAEGRWEKIPSFLGPDIIDGVSWRAGESEGVLWESGFAIFSDSSIHIHNSVTDTFSLRCVLQDDLQRRYATLEFLDNKFYVIGGQNLRNDWGGSVVVVNRQTQECGKVKGMNKNLGDHASVTHGGKIYVAGGCKIFDDYDYNNNNNNNLNTDSSDDEIPVGGIPMNMLPAHNVYRDKYYSCVEVYNPRSDIWKVLQPMNIAHY
jgi:hypothetical protein